MTTILGFSTEVLYRVLVLALMTFASAAALYLAALFKAKAEEVKTNLKREVSGSQRFALDTAIEMAVQAAEQMFKENKVADSDALAAVNKNRFGYVYALAMEAAAKLGIEVDPGTLRALIEAAVYKVKQEATIYKK